MLLLFVFGIATLGLNQYFQNAIQGTGITGPEALILLSPILQLVGGLVLLFLRDEPSAEDKNKANNAAKEQIESENRKLSTLEPSTVGALITDRKNLILKRFEDALKFASDFMGFGNLTLGFGLGFFSLNSNWNIPVIWSLLGLGLALVAFLILYLRWPNYRQVAWTWACDVDIDKTWRRYLWEQLTNQCRQLT